MPDHVHLFVCGGCDFALGLWVRGLKRAVAGARSAGVTLWQEGFFDHLLRNAESYEQKWHYVRENPVRKGLVVRVEDWSYQGEIVVLNQV